MTDLRAQEAEFRARLNGKPEGRRLVLTDLATVRPRPVRWLWQHRIPLGAPTLLAGKPKLGKSTLAYDLAAKVTTGTLDGDLQGKPAGVLVLTFEDLVAETVVPRLTAAGAALERVRTVEVERDGERDLVRLPDDLAGIEEAVAELDARLLIIDPLMAALAGETDSHRDSQVRRVLAPLAKLAERNDLSVLTIMHLNKGQGADLIGRSAALWHSRGRHGRCWCSVPTPRTRTARTAAAGCSPSGATSQSGPRRSPTGSRAA